MMMWPVPFFACRPTFFVAGLAALTLALAGCNATPSYIEPPVNLPAAFTAETGEAVPEDWWTSFNDKALDALLDQALTGNFSLRIAWDRLTQAQALADQSGAPLLPSLDGTAGVGRSVQKIGSRQYTTEFSLGAVVSYEVDLWGRVRSAYDASSLDVAASAQDLEAAAVTLSADVARTWYRLLEQRGQLALVHEQQAVNETYLKAITLRFHRGQVGAADVLQQRQLVESIRGDAIVVKAAMAVLENQLAILVGKTPGLFSPPESKEWPVLPAFPDTGLPANWVRRRPDVKASEIRVRAADRRVATAVADQFPRIALTANASTSADAVRNLFDNWFAGMAANMVAPLFDGGRRKAEVRRTEAVVSQRLNEYGQVVLVALREVEDAIDLESREKELLVSLVKQLTLSRQAKQQTLQNYAKGNADFTRYLTAILSYQQLQRKQLQAQRDLVLFRIDLYRALAGGWDLPTPAQAKIPSPKNKD
jgi:NodT family efflux transporter outer membrane factor (OMF) lipoprotein